MKHEGFPRFRAREKMDGRALFRNQEPQLQPARSKKCVVDGRWALGAKAHNDEKRRAE